MTNMTQCLYLSAYLSVTGNLLMRVSTCTVPAALQTWHHRAYLGIGHVSPGEKWPATHLPPVTATSFQSLCWYNITQHDSPGPIHLNPLSQDYIRLWDELWDTYSEHESQRHCIRDTARCSILFFMFLSRQRSVTSLGTHDRGMTEGT